MYSEIEIAKLCDALSAYKRKKAKTKIKQLIDIGKMHETVVGVAVTAVVLKAYTAKPWMLFLDDITEEKSDWRNEYMRVYFGLNSVVLEQTE